MPSFTAPLAAGHPAPGTVRPSQWNITNITNSTTAPQAAAGPTAATTATAGGLRVLGGRSVRSPDIHGPGLIAGQFGFDPR
ncbi:hypothetical protein PUR61_23435 [Streptomyces sp. BE20]|uniref:hypothetical protein n=1 Tax=Streptomyces sp. BE20 TaxID=3002525 RepID=UPI002E79B24D|nr:hypothetical protein [Streptomyces sp. BE20]MEE1825112.1 hypothetical protein [Streptomyces sp. BE20]